MNRLSTFLFGVVVGGILMLVALKYHVVRAEDGVHLIPKTTSQMGDAFVDIRGFGAEQWADHEKLATAIAQSDKKYLLSDSVADGLRQNVQEVFGALRVGDPE